MFDACWDRVDRFVDTEEDVIALRCHTAVAEVGRQWGNGEGCTLGLGKMFAIV